MTEALLANKDCFEVLPIGYKKSPTESDMSDASFRQTGIEY